MKKSKILLKYSRTALVLEIVGAALILIVLFVVAGLYPSMADAEGRHAALVMPVFAVYLYLILTTAGLIVRRYAFDGKPARTAAAVLTAILAFKAAFLVYAAIFTYLAMQ